MKNRMLIAFVALVATLLAAVAPDAAGQTVIDISSPAPGSGYTIAGGVLTINADGDYIITGATTAATTSPSPTRALPVATTAAY